VTPARSLLVAIVAVALLIGDRPISVIAQFPRGLLAAAPRTQPDRNFCIIETRPLSFGSYDSLATGDLDALAQVIYVCDNQARNIRIEMATGYANQFDRHMSSGGLDRLNYNIYLDATRRTIWGNGTHGTDVFFASNPPNRTPTVVPVFGRIFDGQDVEAGEYFDSINVVILF
jgi:spore coat protein U-like protein